MITQLPLPAPTSAFGDREPVIQSHPRLAEPAELVFGHPDVWDFGTVVERPVNQPTTNYRAAFTGLPPVWNLRAREMAMIWLNPRHPAVLAAGVHLHPQPREPRTVVLRVGVLRALTAWAAGQHLPDDLSRWDREDFHRYVRSLTQRLAIGSVNEHIVVIKALHQFGPVLTGGGLPADPWPGRPARHVLGIRDSEELSTPAIPPETWFPLIRAAWTYIDTFSTDILRARATWQRLHDAAAPIADGDRAVGAWLDDPANLIPVFPSTTGAEPRINWRLLNTMVGAQNHLFRRDSRHRGQITDALHAGRGTQPGLIAGLLHVARPDGSTGPWHAGLHPRYMWLESVALRNACYIFVAALSMMRDSEIRAITHGSLVEHYGTPAVASTKRKRDPDLPTRYWWIIEPAARAITIASQISMHPNLAFGGVRAGKFDELFASDIAISAFVRRVNAQRDHSGLSAIPTDPVTPHMFRRTMAMLTRDYPGSEIAVGMQLKHAATRALANRHSQSYSSPAPAWARYFDTALASARFDRLRDLYDAHHRGEPIGYGPAGDRLRGTFDTVARTAQAANGDARIEYDLLRKARISIRFGKLNHCTFDEADPAGAKCLEDTVVPPGHHGPLVDRCRPGRCANSLIGPEHLPVWTGEERALLTLLDTPKLPTARRALLQRDLADVQAVIRKATP